MNTIQQCVKITFLRGFTFSTRITCKTPLLPSQFRLCVFCHKIVSDHDDARYLGGSWTLVQTFTLLQTGTNRIGIKQLSVCRRFNSLYTTAYTGRHAYSHWCSHPMRNVGYFILLRCRKKCRPTAHEITNACRMIADTLTFGTWHSVWA